MIDTSDLPDELVSELIGPARHERDQQQALFDSRVLTVIAAGHSSIDGILIAYWRTHSEVLKRHRVVTSTNRLLKAGSIKNISPTCKIGANYVCAHTARISENAGETQSEPDATTATGSARDAS